MSDPFNLDHSQSIVLTGGGTGGHLYPALAVAETLISDFQIKRKQITYIGNATSIEATKVPDQNLAFLPIHFSGMPRGKNPIALASWAIQLWAAMIQARKHLISVNADVVLGTGGYVAAPVLMAARLLKIPYVVHESDATPGLVNRSMAPNASKVTAAFSQAQALLKVPDARFIHTGNPISPEIGQLSSEAAFDRIKATLPPAWANAWNPSDTVLLILGGSQGAVSLNKAVVKNLEHWTQEQGLKIIHQCGTKNSGDLKAAYEQIYNSSAPFPEHYVFSAYFDDMPALWGLADIALCRAGSMTLSELCAAVIPAVLVPYPYAAQNHQEANARSLESKGAADVVLDKDLESTDHLIETLSRLMNDGITLAQRKDALSLLARPNATKMICETVLSVATKH